MLSGYFSINGDTPLPTFPLESLNAHLMPNEKGLLVVDTDLPQYGFDIPSRDKRVLHFGSYSDSVKTIDSAFPGMSYADKLFHLGLCKDTGVIVNITEHGSFAVLGSFYAWGLCEVKSKSVYYLFSTDPDRVKAILEIDPLKYFVYRFPTSPVVFFQAQGIRAKWWRWVTNHKCLLHAFNALEHKLYGLSKT